MRHITQTSACFVNALNIHQRKLCLEKDFWTQLKTLMRHFQLQLMQLSYRKRNNLLIRLIEPYNCDNTQVGLIYRFFIKKMKNNQRM